MSNDFGAAKFKSIWAAFHKLVIDNILVLGNAEVASSDSTLPKLPRIARRFVLQVACIESGDPNFSDLARWTLVRLYIDSDEDDVCALVVIRTMSCRLTMFSAWRRCFAALVLFFEISWAWSSLALNAASVRSGIAPWVSGGNGKLVVQ